ncbi:MAG: CopG family antitoxin [Patescibacteria group bacterium]
MTKKLKPIPKFKTIAEEAEFWDTHESTEYAWEEAKDIKFSKNLTSIYKKVVPIRLDEETTKAVKKVAKDKGIGLSTAARMLLRERLQELKILQNA